MLVEYPLEKPHAGRAACRYRRVALRLEVLDARALQAVRLDASLADAKAPFAGGDDVKEPELRHFPFADLRQRAHVVGRRRRADLGALADGANAERQAVAPAALQ